MKPKVKPSEKSRILETKDYSLFNLPDHKVSKRHLGIIKESITQKNLSKDYPILVDDDYNIIEGKYRFLALYESGLPINYKVAEVTDIRDAIRIKWIHKNMPLEDVIKVYSSIKSYNDLLLLKDEFPDMSFRIILMVTEACNYHYWGIDRKKFDSGQMPEFDFNVAKDQLFKVKYMSDNYSLNEYDAWRILGYYDYHDDDGNIVKASFEDVLNDDLYFRSIKKVLASRDKFNCPYSEYEAFKKLKDAATYSTQDIKSRYPTLYDCSVDLLTAIGVRIK